MQRTKNSTKSSKGNNLQYFFKEPRNTTTRERIFFNRLYFDIKIAAARSGYHLNLYEPDVDRDGFDIVVEDQEGNVGWFQLKAVLRSATTKSWEVSVDFIRPELSPNQIFDFDLPERGRGGGIILIEIDDTTEEMNVIYSYTDIHILVALKENFLLKEEKSKTKHSRGRRPNTPKAASTRVLDDIRRHPRDKKVGIPRASFVELASLQALLPLMALWSEHTYARSSINEAYYAGVEISDSGKPKRGSTDDIAKLHYHMKSLSKMLSKESKLKPFIFNNSG